MNSAVAWSCLYSIAYAIERNLPSLVDHRQHTARHVVACVLPVGAEVPACVSSRRRIFPMRWVANRRALDEARAKIKHDLAHDFIHVALCFLGKLRNLESEIGLNHDAGAAYR